MDHATKVDAITEALKRRSNRGPLVLRKKTPSHEVPKPRDARRADEKVDLSNLNQILSIDVEKRICVAEAGVTFADLVAATLPLGLTPTIVPELKTITIGGAVSGGSIESASFRHGGFHDSCLEYEVITGRGEVISCGPDDLVFQMMHGSFGTLGILSKLTFRLIPAKPYVRVRYERYPTFEEYVGAISRPRSADFLDGMIQSPFEHDLAVGHFVDEAPYTNRYDWVTAYHETTRERDEDYFTTADYYFRYDRGVTNVHPQSKVGRFFFGKFVGSTELLVLADKFRWLLPADRPTVILDTFLPMSRAAAFMEWYRAEMGFFPLWCVPYRRVRDYEWIAPRIYEGLEDELFLDLAIYGMKQPPGTNCYRLIEQKLTELGGLKTLISHNFYPEEEFWRTWNLANYQAVKAKTDPDNTFRDLYDKMCRAAQGT